MGEAGLTHLVVSDDVDPAHIPTTPFRIHIVKQQWFWESIQIEASADEQLYQVKVRMSPPEWVGTLRAVALLGQGVYVTTRVGGDTEGRSSTRSRCVCDQGGWVGTLRAVALPGQGACRVALPVSRVVAKLVGGMKEKSEGSKVECQPGLKQLGREDMVAGLLTFAPPPPPPFSSRRDPHTTRTVADAEAGNPTPPSCTPVSAAWT